MFKDEHQAKITETISQDTNKVYFSPEKKKINVKWI